MSEYLLGARSLAIRRRLWTARLFALCAVDSVCQSSWIIGRDSLRRSGHQDLMAASLCIRPPAPRQGGPQRDRRALAHVGNVRLRDNLKAAADAMVIEHLEVEGVQHGEKGGLVILGQAVSRHTSTEFQPWARTSSRSASSFLLSRRISRPESCSQPPSSSLQVAHHQATGSDVGPRGRPAHAWIMPLSAR